MDLAVEDEPAWTETNLIEDESVRTQATVSNGVEVNHNRRYNRRPPRIIHEREALPGNVEMLQNVREQACGLYRYGMNCISHFFGCKFIFL